MQQISVTVWKVFISYFPFKSLLVIKWLSQRHFSSILILIHLLSPSTPLVTNFKLHCEFLTNSIQLYLFIYIYIYIYIQYTEWETKFPWYSYTKKILKNESLIQWYKLHKMTWNTLKSQDNVLHIFIFFNW